jgi:hypothetical protein
VRRLLLLAALLLAAGALSAARFTVQPQPRAGACHARGHGVFTLPDRRCTPGAVDRRVTQRTLATTICRSGYTKTVRPPESVTSVEKRRSMAAYGDSGRTSAYEYDHLISLELGGAPNDARNLWPEPGASPNPKDKLENLLHRRVCDGRMTLAAAQRAIAGDWVAAYHQLIR